MSSDVAVPFYRHVWIFLWVLASISTFASAQTTQPAPSQLDSSQQPVSSQKQYDPWTSKQMTGDWGGLRKELADLGIKLDLSYQQHFQQNYRGGIDTHNAHDFSGSYDLLAKLDFGKLGLIPNAGSRPGSRP